MLTQLIKTTVRAGSQRTFVTTAPKMAGVAKQVSANMLLIIWNAEQLGMNGQSCLVRDNKTIKNNSLSALILNPSIARRIH